MKVGIISDTHDAHASVDRAIEIFNERGVEYVFHAGDMVSPFTASAFSGLKTASFIAVFGNNEGEKLMVTNNIQRFGGQIHGYVYKGEIEGRRIFMEHVPTAIDEVVESGHYDLVIYGHTHKQDIRKIDNTLVVNPGEATDWLTGKSSLVIVELDDMSWEVVALK